HRGLCRWGDGVAPTPGRPGAPPRLSRPALRLAGAAALDCTSPDQPARVAAGGPRTPQPVLPAARPAPGRAAGDRSGAARGRPGEDPSRDFAPPARVHRKADAPSRNLTP